MGKYFEWVEQIVYTLCQGTVDSTLSDNRKIGDFTQQRPDRHIWVMWRSECSAHVR